MGLRVVGKYNGGEVDCLNVEAGSELEVEGSSKEEGDSEGGIEEHVGRKDLHTTMR